MLSYVVVLTNSYNFAYIVIIYRDRVTTQEYMKAPEMTNATTMNSNRCAVPSTAYGVVCVNYCSPMCYPPLKRRIYMAFFNAVV